MKKVVIIFLLIAAVVNTASAQYDAKAKKVLDAMSAKYKAIPAFSANISQHLLNKEEDINDDFKGKITVAGEMFKLEMEGQSIYNNGKTVWTYLKDDNEVNIDTYDPEDDEMSPSAIYNIYKKGYKYLYLESKTIGGKVYDIVDLIPEDKSLQIFKIRMQIGQKDKLLKNWKMFEKNGNRYEYVITNFNPNVNAGAKFFEFNVTKHAGVDVIDLR